MKHDLYVAAASAVVGLFSIGFFISHVAYNIGYTAGSLACSMGG